MLRFDQATYMEELLAKQDQMSMAASIESRVPFLDHHLVEWAAQLPPDVKLRGGIGKALVRLAAERVLAAIDHAREEARISRAADALAPRARRRRSLANTCRKPTTRLFRPHTSGVSWTSIARGRDHTARLWRVLAFQVWRREVTASPARAPAALAC